LRFHVKVGADGSAGLARKSDRPKGGFFVKQAIACLIGIGLAAVADEAAAQCMKWHVPLGQCHLVPATCPNGTPQSLSFENERLMYSRQLTDDPISACNNYKTYGYPNVNGSAVYVPNTQRCFVDENGDGAWQTSEYSVILDDSEIPRESCCEADITGPHNITPDVWYQKILPGLVLQHPPYEGNSYTSQDQTYQGVVRPAQIKQVRNQNRMKTPQGHYYLSIFVSDLYRAGVPVSLQDEEYCDGVLDLTLPISDDCRPEVDHIIPRKDKFGCDCGSNSYKNAHLISRKLNQQLSNNCSDPRRQAILAMWATPQAAYSTPAPSAPAWEADAVPGNRFDFVSFISAPPREGNVGRFLRGARPEQLDLAEILRAAPTRRL
jgi:hypothetical protein